jgi:hypothetical protein
MDEKAARLRAASVVWQLMLPGLKGFQQQAVRAMPWREGLHPG